MTAQPQGYGLPQSYAQPGTQQYTGYQYPQGSVVVTTTTAGHDQPRTPVPCSYIVSLVFAIISCFLGFWILAIPAIVFASMAVSVHSTDPRSAKCFCCTGLWLWIASFVISAIVIVCIFVFIIGTVGKGLSALPG